MKVLITGASGYLGSSLYQLFAFNNEVIGTYSSKSIEGLLYLDITSDHVFEFVKKSHPDLIIHAAALIDQCETDYDLAHRVNIIGGTVNSLV